MATYEERRKELDEKHASALRTLERENTLLCLLPESLLALDYAVHLHKLWDRVGSVHFRFNKYESLREGRLDPTLADVRLQLDTFPAVPLAIYRDGCVSIRTLDDAVREHSKAQKQMAEGSITSATVTPIAPFWARFDASQYSSEFSVHYIAQTSIGLIEMETYFPIYGDVARKVGSVSVTYDHSNDRESRRVHSSYLNIVPKLATLGNARAERVNYSSGDSTTVGQKILYYDSANGEPAAVTLEDFITKIEEV